MTHTLFIILCVALSTFYCGFFLYLRRGFSRLKQGQSSWQSSVTIIVPAHNEEDKLPHLLDCLTNQSYPNHLIEIVLVDDRSEDRTLEIMKNFASTHSNVRTVRIADTIKNMAPKKRAIAEAIRSSTGEIILTTDADASPGPDWILEMVHTYDDDVGMVLGYAPYRTDAFFNTLFQRILALDYFAMGAIAAASTGMGTSLTCNGANLSYRRDTFQKVGGFGRTAKYLSGDDDLLLHRVQRERLCRINFAVSSGSAVYNDPPNNFRQFIRQRIRFASKHLAYPPGIKAVLGGIYAFHVSLIGLTVCTFFSLTYLPVLLTALGMKVVCELSFLTRGQRLLEKRNLLKLYPVAVIPHILYIVLFPILGQCRKNQW